MSLICVSLAATGIDGLPEAARAARRAGTDLVELRLDRLKRPDVRQMRELRRRIDFIPLVATIRPVREGGSFAGSEEQRAALLEQAIECGFDHVDLEAGMGRRSLERLLALCRERGVKSIVSFHDNRGTPDARTIARKMESCASAGDIGKVAFAAMSSRDAVRIIRAARAVGKRPLRFIAIGMGEQGRMTRTLGPFLGSELLYASLGRMGQTAGGPTAGGQPGIGEVAPLWGSKSPGRCVGRSTKLFGLLGFPLGHSLSPLMHNTAFRALGMDAFYMPFEVDGKSLEGTLLALKAANLRGANVTIPHKEAIMRLLDGVDATARAVGAVNTVVNRNGALTGHNTDVAGFTGALSAAGVRPRNADALVMGAGGAARAAVFSLLRQGARVIVAYRSRKRALELRRRLVTLAGGAGIELVDLASAGRCMADIDILVNCTPVGMRGFARGSPVPVGLIGSGATVLDMVYNPVRTPLLAGAERRGARTISGMEMFIRQGMESFRLWTGRTFPEHEVRKALAHSQIQ